MGGGRLDIPMKLNQEAKEEDKIWWRDHFVQSYNEISKDNCSDNLTTDASLVGWGAVYEGNKLGGLFSDQEKQLHSNCLERIHHM